MAQLINSADVYIEWDQQVETLKSNNLGQLPTLYSSDGEFVSVVNSWFFDLVTVNKLKDLSSYSRALLLYWSFLEDSSLQWDQFPPLKRLKPTYLFKHFLLNKVDNGLLTYSTANHYLKHVIQFYIWAIEESVIEIPDEKTAPFVIEFVSIMRSDKLAHLKPKFIVQSADLKIRVPKKPENSLNPLTEDALISFSNQLKKESIEFQLICLLAVSSGLRVSEASSFTVEALNSAIPTTASHSRFEVILGASTGVETKFKKQRKVEVSALLLSRLKNYSISERRLKKANKLKDKGRFEPLFISQYGNPTKKATISARWSDFRKEIKKIYRDFNYTFHDLRSTYATYRLNDLLNAGLNVSESLDCLMSWMGHSEEATTMKYVRYLKRKNAIRNKFALLDQIMHEAVEGTL